MVTVNNCLVCGSDNIAFRLVCSDHLTGGGNFDIYTCKNCGFFFTHNPPSVEILEKYYDAEEYISHSDTKKGFTNILFHITRNLMFYRKRRIIAKTTGLNDGNLLDIGCGTGYFAAFMKKSGWNVTGTEVNKNARIFAREKFNLEVIDEADLTKFDHNHFDCITMWHVFEHLQDPVNYTSVILRLLKPGGVCVAAMPNCDSYDAQYYSQFWAAWDVPRHLWHFTSETFRRFSEKAGLKFSGTLTLPLDVFYISILSEKYKGSKLSFISGILKSLWFSILVLFNKHKTSSLIYILRK
jgi:2-polyprenyl-3-methyl-5-hydroxy-6-metoxy-1,4-benzoquinol methylase